MQILLTETIFSLRCSQYCILVTVGSDKLPDEASAGMALESTRVNSYMSQDPVPTFMRSLLFEHVHRNLYFPMRSSVW